MKKVSLFSGSSIVTFLFALLLGGFATVVYPSSAEAQYTITPQLPPIGTASISDYLGKDRKLKPVSGQSIILTGPSGVRTEVTLSVIVSGSGVQGVASCNGQIATATTRPFVLEGSRTLTASDFTGRSAIGIATSTENQGCIDDLSEKVAQGLGTIPPGRYMLEFTLNDARSGNRLAYAQHPIDITVASVTEITANLVSPANGEVLTSTNNITFQFETQQAGRFFIYEHSLLTQSPEDATKPGGILVMEAPFTRGQTSALYVYPGTHARRPLQIGRKYSWGIEVEIVGGSGQRQTRRSTLYSFTVTSNDPSYQNLLTALNTIGDPISSTFTNLTASGFTLAFSANNPIMIDEGQGLRRIDVMEALRRLSEAAQRGLRLNARLE
jgi:hypothetical protein